MRPLSIFLYEWKHLSRSPFKVVALLLFIIASIYGLHNGADLYEKQNSEIERLNLKGEKERASVISYFENGEKGPKDKPWVDYTEPFWAIWNTPVYKYKNPSPAIVYNIGQTEQYGFYKKITFLASPYDADMAKELANPERIQSGTLDFSFVILFLLPLLVLVLFYNIKGLEAEQGFLPLVFVQTGSKNWWILSRSLFYTCLLFFILLGLMFYGATLTDVFKTDNNFWTIFFCVIIYLLLWVTIYFLILKFGKTTISNTLQMIGIWLLFSFIIPAALQQWVAIEKPANLMVDIIDTKRDRKEEIYTQDDDLTKKQLLRLYPNLELTKLAKDTSVITQLTYDSRIALINNAMKEAIYSLENDNTSKNELVSNTSWFNPITYFQNQLSLLSNTHYNDYKLYRDEIQHLIDKSIEIMILDLWNDVTVDKAKYLEYNTIFQKNE
jgi:ABC-2 type transport system permease protein